MKSNKSWRGIFAIGVLTVLGLTSCIADKEGNVSGLAWLESSDHQVTFVGRVDNFDPEILEYLPRLSSRCLVETKSFPSHGDEEFSSATGVWCYRK